MSVATRGTRAPSMWDCLDQGRTRNFRAAVSLHAHTHHSREILADLPAYIVRIPFVSHLFEREVRGHEEVTDHDDITACLELQVLYNPVCAPVSFEWTARYGEGYFHFGVHNLPADLSALWFARLAEQTRNGGEDRLRDLLVALSDEPQVLVVLNHPQWDLAGIGYSAHETKLARLMTRFRPYVHALELNGYRSWGENEATCALASAKC
jgi:hypothetical protein